MARAITAGWETEANAAVCRPVQLYEGVFQGGSTLRIWNGLGDLAWSSVTWFGNGWFQGAMPAVENQELDTGKMEIHLAGVPLAVVSLALGTTRMGALGRLYVGFLNSSGGVVADPYKVFEGKFDYAEITENAQGSDVRLVYVSEMIEMERPKEFRFNAETQKYFYPEDRGFEFVAGLQDKPIFWGKARDQAVERHKPKKKKKGRGGRKKRKDKKVI